MGSFWKNEPILRGFFAPERAFLAKTNPKRVLRRIVHIMERHKELGRKTWNIGLGSSFWVIGGRDGRHPEHER
jgi:hypothetical protein